MGSACVISYVRRLVTRANDLKEKIFYFFEFDIESLCLGTILEKSCVGKGHLVDWRDDIQFKSLFRCFLKYTRKLDTLLIVIPKKV